MGWRVTINISNGDPANSAELIHRVRNFGEALYSEFRDSSLGEVLLDEADRTTGTLKMHSIHKRDVRRVLNAVNGLAAKHFPEVTPTITAETAEE